MTSANIIKSSKF